MTLTLLQTANFGSGRANITGSLGVGYTVLDVDGNVVTARTTLNVSQSSPGSGNYFADVTYPTNFNGQIVWDCPQVTSSLGAVLGPAYACEQQNFQANDPSAGAAYALLSGTLVSQVQGLYDVAFGRWKINKLANQMVFYRADNVTVVATFNLLDDFGNPTFDGVFERQLAGAVTP
jgi:hypothetical protein